MTPLHVRPPQARKIKVTPVNSTISGIMIAKRDRIQIKLEINPVTFCSFKAFAMANDTDGLAPNSLSSINVHQPDVLFIDYALNDRSAGIAKAKDAWEKMIRAAREKNIKVILLTSSPDQRVDILAEGNDLEVHSEQIPPNGANQRGWSCGFLFVIPADCGT